MLLFIGGFFSCFGALLVWTLIEDTKARKYLEECKIAQYQSYEKTKENNMAQHKPSTTKKSGNGSKRK